MSVEETISDLHDSEQENKFELIDVEDYAWIFKNTQNELDLIARTFGEEMLIKTLERIDRENENEKFIVIRNKNDDVQHL